MALFYRIAADVIVIAHMVYFLTVVLGLPAIWAGILLKQRWARDFWWRCGHLAMILIVVAEAWAGLTCPLTAWEAQLRALANQETYQGAFIANLVHEYLFVDAPPWFFTLAHTTFGALVLASFLIAPPNWPTFGKSNLPAS